MKVFDILLDDDGDLLIDEGTGDLVIGESTEQEVQAILQATQGNYKNDPLVGANLATVLGAKGGAMAIKAAVKTALARDGKALKDFAYNNGKLKVEAQQQ